MGDPIARHLQQHEQVIVVVLGPLVPAQEREAWFSTTGAWLALPRKIIERRLALPIIARLKLVEKPVGEKQGLPIGRPRDVMAGHAAQLVVEQFAQLTCLAVAIVANVRIP